jgi:hypothetical protein
MASSISAGTTSSTALVATADTTGALQLATNNGTVAVTIDTNQRTAFVAGTAALPAITTTGDTNTGIFFPAADTIAFAEGGAEAMRIDSSGNVGIGTTSPTNGKLVITGNSVTTAQGIRLTGDTADARFICESATLGAGILGTFSAHAQLFYTNSAERMRIHSDGNIMIGTSTYPTFGNGPKLFVQGDGTGIAVGYGTATSQYRIFYMNSGDGTLYWHNNSNYASLSAAGAWTNASDVRLKKNIVDIKYGLADVLKTQPRSYQMNDVAGNFVGFVAQELLEVIPEVVSGDPEKQLGVDYGSLVAVAFKAIQELTAKVTALEEQVLNLGVK